MDNSHELKTWPEYFQAVWDGNKTFELRKNDRDYQVGNRLILREWCPKLNDYTGRRTARIVSWILKDAEGFGLKDGYVILGFEESWAF